MSNPDQIAALALRVTKELRFLDCCPEEVVIDGVDLLARIIVAELRGQEPDKEEFYGVMKTLCKALLNHPEIQRRI